MVQPMKQLSSIFSFETLPWAGYLRFARKCAIFAAFFAVLEGLSYLFVPPMHPLEAVTRKKAELFQHVMNDGATTDTVFVGSSITEEGMDVGLFADRWGGAAFNAGLAGTANVSFAADLIREIVAKKHPSLIVYGIENFAFDRGTHNIDTQMFRFLNLYQQRSQIIKWIGKALRGSFVAPPAFWDAQAHAADFDKRFSQFEQAFLHSDGWVEVHATANFAAEAGDPPSAFSAGPVQVQAINEIERLSAETGIPVVFVQFPESVHAAFSTPDRMRDFRQFMSEYVEKVGFVFLDFNMGMSFPRDNPNFYYDWGHLNSEGAKLFAPLLAGEIAGRCRHLGTRVTCM